jgi:hypothetical protein
MAGIRGLVVGLVLSSAMISIPARAQIGSSVSLTHIVSVTVPPRVKVQVANLAFSSPVPPRVSSSQVNVGGLALTINASQAWVLAIGSTPSPSTQKSSMQWSTNGSSGFSTINPTGTAVASSVTGYESKAANLYFRNGASAGQTTDGASTDSIVLTITAP